jgi:hypothetical protein
MGQMNDTSCPDMWQENNEIFNNKGVNKRQKNWDWVLDTHG